MHIFSKYTHVRDLFLHVFNCLAPVFKQHFYQKRHNYKNWNACFTHSQKSDIHPVNDNVSVIHLMQIYITAISAGEIAGIAVGAAAIVGIIGVITLFVINHMKGIRFKLSRFYFYIINLGF